MRTFFYSPWDEEGDDNLVALLKSLWSDAQTIQVHGDSKPPDGVIEQYAERIKADLTSNQLRIGRI